MTKADELLRELVASEDQPDRGPASGYWQRRGKAFGAARDYLNEKPMNQCAATNWTKMPTMADYEASPPHAAAEPERDALQKLSAHEHKQLEFYRKATTAAEPEKPMDPQRIDDWYLPSTHAEPPAPAAAEPVGQPVAWLYVHQKFGDKSFTWQRWERHEGWTETPLYASPSAQPPVSEDLLENAYWEFDARKKGYAAWKGLPQSERDAFKSAVKSLLSASPVASPAQPIARDDARLSALVDAMARCEGHTYCANNEDYGRGFVAGCAACHGAIKAAYDAALKSAGKEST